MAVENLSIPTERRVFVFVVIERDMHGDTTYNSNMSRFTRKLVSVFLCSSGVLLLMTSLAKLASATGSARALLIPDPILLISFRAEFVIIGAAEILVGSVCLIHSGVSLRAGLIAWLSTAFSVYRFGLWAVGWHKPCACLGNLTDVLGISPQAADSAMRVILAYLLIGSYMALFCVWRHRKSASAPLAA